MENSWVNGNSWGACLGSALSVVQDLAGVVLPVPELLPGGTRVGRAEELGIGPPAVQGSYNQGASLLEVDTQAT